MRLNLDPISNIAGVADKILGRFKPSLEERSKASLDQYNAETHRLEVTKDERMAEHAERMERLKIEQSLTQSKDAAKIRPMIGKVCVWGIGMSLIPPTVATFIYCMHQIMFAFNQTHVVPTQFNEPPEFPLAQLITLLGSALGQGLMRTVEKLKGVEGNRG